LTCITTQLTNQLFTPIPTLYPCLSPCAHAHAYAAWPCPCRTQYTHSCTQDLRLRLYIQEYVCHVWRCVCVMCGGVHDEHGCHALPYICHASPCARHSSLYICPSPSHEKVKRAKRLAGWWNHRYTQLNGGGGVQGNCSTLPLMLKMLATTDHVEHTLLEMVQRGSKGGYMMNMHQAALDIAQYALPRNRVPYPCLYPYPHLPTPIPHPHPHPPTPIFVLSLIPYPCPYLYPYSPNPYPRLYPHP